MIIFLPDIMCADERRQSPHIPLEDALVHRIVCGATASVCDDSDGARAGHKSLGWGGGSHGGIVRRQSRGARGVARGRGCLQLQPVVMVTENLMAGFAALAAARAKPASRESAAEGSRRFLIPGLKQVPLFFAGLVVPPQRADLLSGHRRHQRQQGDPGGSPRETELALRRQKAISAPARSLQRRMNSRSAAEPGTHASPADWGRLPPGDGGTRARARLELELSGPRPLDSRSQQPQSPPLPHSRQHGTAIFPWLLSRELPGRGRKHRDK